MDSIVVMLGFPSDAKGRVLENYTYRGPGLYFGITWEGQADLVDLSDLRPCRNAA
jgi:hypothetical protein